MISEGIFEEVIIEEDGFIVAYYSYGLN